jgi:hypothetical protein
MPSSRYGRQSIARIAWRPIAGHRGYRPARRHLPDALVVGVGDIQRSIVERQSGRRIQDGHQRAAAVAAEAECAVPATVLTIPVAAVTHRTRRAPRYTGRPPRRVSPPRESISAVCSAGCPSPVYPPLPGAPATRVSAPAGVNCHANELPISGNRDRPPRWRPGRRGEYWACQKLCWLQTVLIVPSAGQHLADAHVAAVHDVEVARAVQRQAGREGQLRGGSRSAIAAESRDAYSGNRADGPVPAPLCARDGRESRRYTGCRPVGRQVARAQQQRASRRTAVRIAPLAHRPPRW